MATNREKYIDNASNEELANLLANKCIIYKNKIETPCLDEIEGAVRIENWLSQEVELTADEMFEELRYKKDTFDEFGANEIVYINNNKDHIIVRKNGHYIKYNYYDFHPDFDYNDIKFITEAEDKAIHKKIEELKK